MKKKAIISIISIIAGIFILCLCVKPADGSRDELAVKNISVEAGIFSDGLHKQMERELAELINAGETKPELEAESEPWWCKIKSPGTVKVKKPEVTWNGEEGIPQFYGWSNNRVWIGKGTFLLACDYFFPEAKLQQKVFFIVKGPYFTPVEVFRQDSRTWDEELRSPEILEWRMPCPYPVDGGYVYEMDGVLYFLDRDFQEASPLCDIRQLMGDSYLFSPGTPDICDVTEDASKLLVCMDEGLYEYDLESGERQLLEPAFFAHREIVHVEGDCTCGDRDFLFSGPVKAEYAPDEQSYAFLTGTEEADWGDTTGVILRSRDGETRYQKEMEYIYDFSWVESEDTIYLEVSYTGDNGEKTDRVDVNTGEVMAINDQ